MRDNRSKLIEKSKETLKAVLPIIMIVLLLSFTVAPISPEILMEFLIGAVMLIVGMLFFSIGAEMAMTPMGERVGTTMTKSRNLAVMVFVSFALGFVITISEPDLQVLAQQVPSVPNAVLILAVAAGVGILLVFALLRMLLRVALPPMLLLFYAVVFALAAFVPKDFLAVAFDSGGVTTGPMTVPFIMAFGVGISAIRSDKHAAEDSFGLVSLCSVGPIIAVLILGMIYHPQSTEYLSDAIPEITDTVQLGRLFAKGIPVYLREMALSLLPIVLFFGAFQLISRDIKKKTLIKILIGLVYTYVGLVLFLTGVNVGFMPAGNLSGTGDCRASLCMDHHTDRHGDRLFHRSGGAGGICAHEAGGGDHLRSYFGDGDGEKSFRRCCGFDRAGNDTCAYGDFHYVVYRAGVCDCPVSDFFCPENIYFHRV